MTSVKKKGKYTTEDLVDKYILSRVSEHVNYSQIRNFAKKLNIGEADYERITGKLGLSQKQQIEKVSKK